MLAFGGTKHALIPPSSLPPLRTLTHQHRLKDFRASSRIAAGAGEGDPPTEPSVLVQPKPAKRPVPAQSTTKYVVPPAKQMTVEPAVVAREGAGEVEFATFSRSREGKNGQGGGNGDDVTGAGGGKPVSGAGGSSRVFDLSGALDEGVKNLGGSVTPNWRNWKQKPIPQVQRFPTDLMDLAPNELGEAAQSTSTDPTQDSRSVGGAAHNDEGTKSVSKIDSSTPVAQPKILQPPKLNRPPPGRKTSQKTPNAPSKTQKAWGPQGGTSGRRHRHQQGSSSSQNSRASPPIRDQAAAAPTSPTSPAAPAAPAPPAPPVRPTGNHSSDTSGRAGKPRTSTVMPTASAPSRRTQHNDSDAATAYFRKNRRQPERGQTQAAEEGLPTELVTGDLAAYPTGMPRKDRGSRRSKNQNSQDADGKTNTQGKSGKRRGNAEGRFGGLTAENRRKARQQRQERRELRVVEQEREEIIEVGSDGIAVNDLASQLAVPPAEIVKVLFMRGIMSTVTQTLDMDTVKAVGLEYGVEIWDKSSTQVTDMAKKTVDFMEEEEVDHLKSRPPVVTVMGHVDHGKTSLLDHIRRSSVASGEAGGITQAIGAYTCQVNVDEEVRTICFLDTPGHEAFGAMRARGAKVTDVAVIIIAADDGIQPQTREAVSHAKAAEVPIVVAINKIDAPGANVERTKQQIGELDLIPEEWGGKTPVVPVSAKTGEGISNLLEIICLLAEVDLELLANPDRAAAGTVVEADLDRKSGPVATMLVQNGTLRVGDIVVAGASFGKVRSLTSDIGDQAVEAGPSTPVRMLGLDSVPKAGDNFEVVSTDAEARERVGDAVEQLRAEHLAEVSGGGNMVTLSSLASIDEDADGIQRINIVLKADTSGAMEAVKGALGKLPQDSIMLRYLHAAAGDITESDITLAATAEAFVLGFNIHPSEAMQARAKKIGVDIRSYDVIYDLIDEMRAAMEGRIRAVDERIPIGEAEVKAVFGVGPNKVAGCLVSDGRLEKGAFIQVKRKKRVVFEGEIISLRRGKDSASVVESGLECGVGAEFVDWKEGDKIAAFNLVAKSLTLEEASATPALDLKELEDELNSTES